MTYYAVVDCDNCYVSCELVFRPDLKGKPVVVLSNNDGCVVARSNEAKQMGIKAGTPYFKLASQFPNQKIYAFSSNYELYGDLTGRVMSIVQNAAPQYFRYSIDEAFVLLKKIEGTDLREWGMDLHQKIKQFVGMPVSIGIGATKTLAKMASHYAKHYPGYRHCCFIDTEEKLRKALKLYPIAEVWGIGRKYAVRMQNMGIVTAYDLAEKSREWINAGFNVNIRRTWSELNGIDCIPNDEPAKKKSICVSRSFPGMIGEFDKLRTYVSNYAAHCAEKLRKQHSMAAVVGVFLSTNNFREDLSQYRNFTEVRLLTPTDSSITIIQKARECLEKIYRPGFLYKRAGVVVISMDGYCGVQTNLIDYDSEKFEKLKKLDSVIDRINKTKGSETVIVASQQYQIKNAQGKSVGFADAIRHEHKSPNYTTRWADIIELK